MKTKENIISLKFGMKLKMYILMIWRHFIDYKKYMKILNKNKNKLDHKDRHKDH